MDGSMGVKYFLIYFTVTSPGKEAGLLFYDG